MKILNFGSCNIDYVYSLDHIVAVGETQTTHKLETFPGGKGLNQSIAVSKAGAKVYHAGCVGRDGTMLTDILAENAADLSYLKISEGKTGHAIIQVSKSGENSIFLYPGANEALTEADVDAVLENFQKGDLLILQNEISCVAYIVEKAYEKQMCILFNPSPFNERIGAVDFNKLSYIMINEVEAKEISGREDPMESLKHIRQSYPKLKVLLTLGGSGCIYADAERTLFQPAFQVEVVDTTAAGDTFTGYFAAELARGTKPQEILKLASAAAAISVSKMGAAPSIPDRQEVLARIETLKEDRAHAYLESI